MNNNNGQILSNYDLINIGKKLNLNLTVICIDELKDYNDNKLFIINLSKTTEKGSHWICYSIYNNNSFYYDSFGRKPPIEIIEHLKKNNFYLMYNKKKHQDKNDYSCGWYCIFHILTLLYNNFNFRKTINILSNKNNNNKIIEYFFDRLFNI
jgi:hypothetical protein